jgi:uncharacterized membrane protein YqhA
MTARRWIARSIIAGASGSVVHFLFMYFKSVTGLLPQFQPYHSFQVALAIGLARMFLTLSRGCCRS